MTETDIALREIFRTMKADHVQQIRDAYYQVAEGLRTLADTLEAADAELPEPGNVLLIGEHLLACEAMDTMQESKLGRVL